ncbi:hypothetical protein BAUCODRAFT_25369 [Baudoinia panamericana UAMH 10762]|uniref:Zn(2)-C6 fungal-type domain-containing protein n=1 Tax=Baudoinia panamericana (strain UAMH 10762) TaxID=717646 RepID=M2LLW0_BAUPA|nr:uncharacterized protein BAUCODRAFT_25369 [Baudoinia panamericana UAMH 10762]EMC95302.1 hypothetical protein BAUCODRAFT_25369 [Baudoinia panamericana UAMH 10762]
MSNCDRCYRRKAKCDKLKPCGNCSRAGVPCIYLDRTKEKRYSADHVERLERRILQAEARNKTLSDELSRARAGSDTQGSTASPGLEQRAVETLSKDIDVVTEVSFLSTSAAGERLPYLGSTSGVLFADLIRSSVDDTFTRPSRGNHSSSSGGVEHKANHSTASRPEPAQKLEDLPPQHIAQRLLTAFLEHDNLAYPFISPLSIIETAERIYTEDGYYASKASPYEVFVFNMVLAIASAHVSKFDWQMLSGAELYQSRAFARMDHVLSHGSVESLQCLLLILIWRTGSSVKDNSASMWHTVGIAVRMVLELGLHRESAYAIRETSELDVTKLQAYRQQELSRRCFWCVVSMDRITSNILGRPLGIADEDIDAALPSEASDALLSRPLASTISGVQRIAVFNRIVKYRLFCGKLIVNLHRKRSAKCSIEEALRLRDDLMRELDMWYTALQDLQLPDTIPTNTREQSCYLSPTWYEVLYANATLMIWRPCPLLADAPHDRHTLQRIYASAMHAINTYATLHKNRSINYSWITLQSVFMAGLSYIYAVSRHVRDRHNAAADACLLDRDPSAIDVVNITRACSNVLVAVAERWDTQRHCHEVFDRLSDAILADVIKLQTTAAFAQQLSPSVASPAGGNLSAMTRGSPASSQHPSHIPQMPSPNQLSYWNTVQHQPSHDHGPLDPSPLQVDNEFLHCFDDIQQLYSSQQLEEPIMHLSQEWRGYLGGNGLPDGYVPTAAQTPLQMTANGQAPYHPQAFASSFNVP